MSWKGLYPQLAACGNWDGQSATRWRDRGRYGHSLDLFPFMGGGSSIGGAHGWRCNLLICCGKAWPQGRGRPEARASGSVLSKDF